MLSAASSSGLVAGGARAPAAPASAVTVCVLRSVMVAGARVEVGAEIAVTPHLAADLVASGKAERVSAAAPPHQDTAPASAGAPTKAARRRAGAIDVD